MKTIEQTVLKFIEEKKLFKPGDKVLIALSGGPDSVFLSYLLNKFKKKLKIEIGAFHVNHTLRGKSADADESFCREFTKNLRIEFSSVKIDVNKIAEKNKISTEEAGREVRYSELQKYSKKYHFDKIVTAHTADDNAETILLNLIKGTGLKGISGIPIVRENIVRPLLSIRKSEILNCLNENKIKFQIDKTNLSNDYERNFIRNEIIPRIKAKLNPSIEESLFYSSEIFKDYYSYIQNEVNLLSKSALKKAKDNAFVLSNEIQGIHPVIRREFLKAAVERNFFVQSTFNDIKNLELLITQQKGKKINLANGLSAVKEKDGILISKNLDEFHTQLTRVFIGKENQINGFKLFLLPKGRSDIKFSSEGLREFISADNIEGPLFVRNWTEGDRFIPLGMKGFKKISDFLTDQNVASSEKKKQLVLTDKNRIVWVIGLRIDERFKITKATKKILQTCITY
jgi:tRNA(Ile)-lysidine synthase